jgi:hypothetical protein
MKLHRIITILLGVVALATMVAVLCDIHFRRVVDSEVSEVYRRYRNRSDLNVAFVKDYRIGDSITVDVTTITAKDSAGWGWLMETMNSNPLIDSLHRESQEKEHITLSMFKCPKGKPEIHYCNDTISYDIVIYSPMEKNIYVFNIINERQVEPLFKAYFYLLLKQSKNEHQN